MCQESREKEILMWSIISLFEQHTKMHSKPQPIIFTAYPLWQLHKLLWDISERWWQKINKHAAIFTF